MGNLGRVLVLLHGALSIGVLAWAIGVYSQRINWNNPPASAGGATLGDRARPGNPCPDGRGQVIEGRLGNRGAGVVQPEKAIATPGKCRGIFT